MIKRPRRMDTAIESWNM